MYKSLFLASFAKVAFGGTILWDGRFNDLTSSADLEKWSFSNAVGPYQYYIHGDSNVTSYVNLDSTFKNPADTSSSQGVKITIDNTAYWNGQTMRRTEIIPQTTAAINAGTVYYHFSMQRTDVNPPSEFREHQIAFFESHFTEMKSGWQSGAAGTSDSLLRWNADGSTQWNTTWEAGVWHNVAYEINFDAGSVAFYHSTGADDLVLTVPAVSVTATSDGKDWHLGVLELPRDGYADENEDIYFSGVYVESGDLTASISGPGAAQAVIFSPSVEVSAAPATTSASVALSTATSAPVTTTIPSSAPVEVSTSAQVSSASSVASPAGTESSAVSSPSAAITSATIIIRPSTTLATVIRSSATPAISSPDPTGTTLPGAGNEDVGDSEYDACL